MVEETLRSNIPIPDPSQLTVELLRRELGALRELLETRLDGMDSAQNLLKESVRLVAESTKDQIAHLKELHSEKFAERDIAVSAAFAAQEKLYDAQNRANTTAMGKSEDATRKQIDSLGLRVDDLAVNTNEKIADLRSRIDRGEGSDSGARVNRTDAHMTMGNILGVVGGVVAVLSLIAITIFGILTVTNTHATPPAITSNQR